MSDGTQFVASQRSHRFRNLLLATAALLLLLIGLHWGFRHYEYRRFMSAVHSLQRAGEPVLPADVPQIADDGQNPATPWRQAARDIDPRTLDLERDLYAGDLEFPLTKREAERLHELVSINAKSLTDATTAGGARGEPRWQVRINSPVINIQLRELNEEREVARLLQDAVLEAHQRGDDREALKRIEQIIRQQRAVYYDFGIIGHLVAIGIGAMADRTILQMGTALRLDNSPSAASTDQVRQLISDLLNDAPQRQAQRRAFQGERMLQADTVVAVDNGTLSLGSLAVSGTPAPSSQLMGYLLSPTLFGDGVVMLHHTTRIIEVAQAPDWPTCANQLRGLNLGRYKGDVVRHLLLSVLTPAYDRALQQDFRLMTENRLCAALLACRLYARYHDGRMPRSLDDLVPSYLPTVPLDPMTSGKPLRLRGGADPIVYSVGDDGSDDGGSEQPTGTRPQRDLWMTKDAVVHLTPQPRRSPPQLEEDNNSDGTGVVPATQPGS